MAFPPLTVLHVLRSLPHFLFLGSKCAVMSSRPASVSAAAISAPDDARTIERVVTALGDQPRGTGLIVVGDLNTDLGEMESDGRGTEGGSAD